MTEQYIKTSNLWENNIEIEIMMIKYIYIQWTREKDRTNNYSTWTELKLTMKGETEKRCVFVFFGAE